MNAKQAKKLRKAVRGYAQIVDLTPEVTYNVQRHRNGMGTLVTEAGCERGFYRRAKKEELQK